MKLLRILRALGRSQPPRRLGEFEGKTVDLTWRGEAIRALVEHGFRREGAETFVDTIAQNAVEEHKRKGSGT